MSTVFVFVATRTDILSCSSQSVSRLNTHWSNNPKLDKPPRNQDGFAGREDLEATQRYRDSHRVRDPHGGYGMVFDVDELPRSGRDKEKRERRNRHSRSRSPRRPRERERSRSRDRMDRFGDRDRDRRRNRER